MYIKKCSLISVVLGIVASSLAFNASAGDVSKCEKRTSPARSRVSAEFEGFKPGAMFTATVSSGANTATSSVSAADLGGVVEFDFDSNQKDILAGATAIAPNFIVSSTVAVVLKDAMGNTVDTASSTCKIR